MANKYKIEDDEIECEIIESYGVFSDGAKNWKKEVNLVSWNGRPAKFDIRSWQSNHEKCGKGITLTREEAEELVKLLNKILKAKETKQKEKKPERQTKTGTATKKTQSPKKPVPPQTLKPFYDELELPFGASADKCKSARNTLLKKYHPDHRTEGRNSENITFATMKTIKIKEAYDKIMEWWNGATI
jgi:hypothetical protein